MAQEIHYEIFVQPKKSREWKLLEAIPDRNAALKTAKTLTEQGIHSGVKVMKEILNSETGQFDGVSIYEEGGYVATKKDKSEAAIPCFKPQDLYSIHARATIARVLEDTLDRLQITVKELLHRGDLLENLEATGTVLQHAVQKIAIAQASEDNVPVSELMKQLNDLISKAMERVYVDTREKSFPKLSGHDIGKVYEQVKSAGDVDYYLSGSIAMALKDKENWTEKVTLLLSLMNEMPADEKGRLACLATIDDFVAEVIGGGAGLGTLIGNQEHLGDGLMTMADLFLGRPSEQDSGGLLVLAKRFLEDALPNSKSALAQRMLTELKGVKRFCIDDIDKEVEFGRTLAMRMVLCQGKYIALEAITEAFTNRSKRLVTPEVVGEYLVGYDDPDKQIERLLQLEENVLGEENKRRLSAFVIPAITGYKTETFFMDQEGPLPRRLADITALQSKARKSSFDAKHKAEISDALDAICMQVIDKAKLFEAIKARKGPPAEKAMTFLRLCAANVFTAGECSRRANNTIIKYVRTQSFMAELATVKATDKYLADTGGEAAQAIVAEFKDLLDKTGVGEMLSRSSSAA